MVIERNKFAVGLLVALAGFILGLAVGKVSACRDPGRTRIEWPTPAHPRSLEP
jgi:hypothetical protein